MAYAFGLGFISSVDTCVGKSSKVEILSRVGELVADEA